jgi:hypothetical protein
LEDRFPEDLDFCTYGLLIRLYTLLHASGFSLWFPCIVGRWKLGNYPAELHSGTQNSTNRWSSVDLTDGSVLCLEYGATNIVSHETYPRYFVFPGSKHSYAYTRRYPNAGTLLSSQIRASPPDGKSFFKKTRSKKRCPFAEEEGRSLRTGYDERGVLWGQVVKGPIFQEQKRRSATGSGTRFPIRAKWWGTNLGRRRRKRSWFLYSPVCCDR